MYARHATLARPRNAARLNLPQTLHHQTARVEANPQSVQQSLLLVCNRPVPGSNAATISDHLDAFRLTGFRIFELPMVGRIPRTLSLARFDIVVVHYTLQLGEETGHFLDDASLDRIAVSPGLKVIFIQDEYRNVNLAWERLRRGRFDLLFSIAPSGEIEKLYPSAKLPGLKVESSLAGYVPDYLLRRKVMPIAARPITVGYRARRMQFWLGALAQEKVFIAEEFCRRVAGTTLVHDVSPDEADRLYGPQWIEHLAACKATLGVESGASVVDFDGSLRRQVDRYVEDNPEAGFSDVRARFFPDSDGKILINPISPRLFEAVALRTALVLFEGSYSGVLQPGRHYIVLKKDFSNFEQVLTQLRDEVALQELADRAYREIACNPKYSYQAFADQFAASCLARMRGLPPRRTTPLKFWQFYLMRLLDPGYALQRALANTLQRFLLTSRMRGTLFRHWEALPLAYKLRIRPILKLIGR